MPFDSNGNYSLPTSYFVENGDTVLPIQHNPPLEDIQQALSGTLLRSGIAPMSGNLKMGTKRIVDLAGGVAATDGVNKQQLDLATASLAALRNKIINPLFAVNQRVVTGTVVLAANQYGHDMMRAGASGCAYTFAASNGVTTINIQAGTLQQVIEASAFAGDAGTYILSWLGTAQGRIGAGSYGASGAVSATCDGSANVTVEWNTGTLALPRLERDYLGTFAALPSALERVRCQVYFETSYDDVPFGTITTKGTHQSGILTAFFLHSGRINFRTPKRIATPSIAFCSPVSGAGGNIAEYSAGSVFVADRTGVIGAASSTGFEALISGGTGTPGNYARLHWVADATI